MLDTRAFWCSGLKSAIPSKQKNLVRNSCKRIHSHEIFFYDPILKRNLFEPKLFCSRPAKTLRCLPRNAFCAVNWLRYFYNFSKIVLIDCNWSFQYAQNANSFAYSTFCMTYCLAAFGWLLCNHMRLLASNTRQHFREIAAPKSFCTWLYCLVRVRNDSKVVSFCAMHMPDRYSRQIHPLQSKKSASAAQTAKFDPNCFRRRQTASPIPECQCRPVRPALQTR